MTPRRFQLLAELLNVRDDIYSRLLSLMSDDLEEPFPERAM